MYTDRGKSLSFLLNIAYVVLLYDHATSYCPCFLRYWSDVITLIQLIQLIQLIHHYINYP